MDKIVKVYIVGKIDPATGEDEVLRTYSSAKLEADEAPITDAEEAAKALCADRPGLRYEVVKAKKAAGKAGGNVSNDDGDDEDEEVSYADLSQPELKKECAARKIVFPAKATKEQLIALLEKHDEANASK